MSEQPPLPGFATMYAALCERDPAFDGLFFVCVRTTGRPCRRCRPLEAPESHPAWVLDLLSRMRASELRLSDPGLGALGLSPTRVRRYFRRRFGVTFQAFQRAQRMGGALRRLHAGQDSLGAGFDSGYESSSGFRDAFTAAFGHPPGRADHVKCLVAGEIATPLRPMLAVASERGLCLLEFLDRRAIATALRDLRRRFGVPIVPGSSEHVDRLRAELASYFGGALRRFEVPLDLAGTAFQRRVWRRLREIPFGDTVSYARVAKEVGRREAVRAVGHANGRNPVAIVVPCHRVVRTDGSLCGYGGGLWRKRWLLQHERDALRPSGP
jgi:AraC family transcriptional regulator, regulatory protein of adaptative response / methylated-DNA-[protein]-cysteine methyltransferase